MESVHRKVFWLYLTTSLSIHFMGLNSPVMIFIQSRTAHNTSDRPVSLALQGRTESGSMPRKVLLILCSCISLFACTLCTTAVLVALRTFNPRSDLSLWCCRMNDELFEYVHSGCVHKCKPTNIICPYNGAERKISEVRSRNVVKRRRIRYHHTESSRWITTNHLSSQIKRLL